MTSSKASTQDLEASLQALTARGIEADRKRLMEDMTLQFSDHREWIREYVTNAVDAHARRVWISGEEVDETLTVTVVDDGHGMDRQGVLDFMTLYRSRKQGAPDAVIGRHGIGKLSAAAIPGQCAFRMRTSTGKECWRMVVGRLLDDRPIRLERVVPVPPPGTRFDVTFARKETLGREMAALRRVLERYVCHLPLDILIAVPDATGDAPYLSINQDWNTTKGSAGRGYRFTLDGRRFEVTLGLGRGEHEVFQNRVLVSTRYNLLSADLDEKLEVPCLRVRVDSPDFELPFGRHALRDDDVLQPLARYLRLRILPDYMGEICDVYRNVSPEISGVDLNEIEAASVALLRYDSNSGTPWSRMAVLYDVFGRRHSLEDLKGVMATSGALYLEAKGATGVDYEVFGSPVLSCRQPVGGLELLHDVFGEGLINLGLSDVVLEAPAAASPALGPAERRLERYLRFHPRALSKGLERTHERGSNVLIAARLALPDREVDLTAGVCAEAVQALEDVRAIRWRVSYLVGPDGRTPALSQRYLKKEQTVVLNLHHPEVTQLLRLAARAPALAGHFGLAMVLGDPQMNVLPHLSAEAREDLIMADALAKCAAPDEFEEADAGSDSESESEDLDFNRNLGNRRFGVS